MLSVMSFNCNGIRAAARKGFFAWFQEQDVDVLCLQETKAHMRTMYDATWQLPGYEAYFSDAVKKGYSGVGIYTRRKALNPQFDLGDDLSRDEGRFLQLDIEGIRVASIYFPSGTTGDVRQNHKMAFLDTIGHAILNRSDAHQAPTVLAGDWNIAHHPIDLKNWQSNQKNTGFLPEERAWLTQCANQWGWVDACRRLHPDKACYSWWTYRANARARNVGWRLDYQWINRPLVDRIISADICDQAPVFSDHAPVVVRYAL